jgi:RNA polymerase sigma factor (sigma-70 family)
MTKQRSLDLIRRVREGDATAAKELFDRYVERLLGLVRTRLSAKLARRIDPADVVQSAYGSFFVRVREGRFEISESGDLWRLLAAIAINKLLLNARHHRAKKRDIAVEESVSGASVYGVPVRAIQGQPTPEEALIMYEELARELESYSPLKQQIVQMRLQGLTVEEISGAAGCTRRTVQRTLQQLKESLEEQLRQHSSVAC